MPRKTARDDLKMVINSGNLRSLAGNVYFGRGEEYFEDGRVKGLKERGGVVRATVTGTHPYKVRLQGKSGMLEAFCSCPLGDEGEYCKHIVATGLAWIAEHGDKVKPAGRKKQLDISAKQIEKWLRGRQQNELVKLIMERAGEDDRLYDALKMRVAADSGAVNVTAMRSVIRSAIESEDYDSWRDGYEYGRDVDRVVRQLEDLLEGGHARQAMELAEYAIELCEGQLQYTSDSDSTLSIAIDDLVGVHFDACREAKPNPRKLAEKLLERELNEEWEFWSGSYERYGPVLGKEGRQAYRELATRAWEKLPAVPPGKKSPQRYGYRMTLTGIMKEFAEKDRDFDRLIEVMSKDLSEPYDFLQVAERCRKARKYNLAREWAERGVRAFSKDPDPRMRKFLAEEYARSKREDEAIELIWSNFTDHPGLDKYQELMKYADRLKQKDAWREKALIFIRDRMAGNAASPRLRMVLPTASHSLLVEIFLWEKNDDDAWKEAQAGGCSDSLWFSLAKRREKDHPADTVPVYQRLVEKEINRKNNQSYQDAVSLIGHIRKLFLAMRRKEDFRSYLTEVKARHRAKRNLMKYLAGKSWGR